MEGIRRGHTRSHTRRSYVRFSDFFLINMPYAESYAESYEEVIRDLVFFEACHTQASHTRKPYAGIFFDSIFCTKYCVVVVIVIVIVVVVVIIIIIIVTNIK